MDERTTGLRSLLPLARETAQLCTCRMVWHLDKLIALLRKSQVRAMHELCSEVSAERLREALPTLLGSLTKLRIKDVLAPLVNSRLLRPSIAAVLESTDAKLVAEIVSSVPASKLSIVLSAPPRALVEFLSTVNDDRIKETVIPLLMESDGILTGTLLPLLQQVHNPERVAHVVNRLQPKIVLASVRTMEPWRMAAFCDAFDISEGATPHESLRGWLKHPDVVVRVLQGPVGSLHHPFARMTADGAEFAMEYVSALYRSIGPWIQNSGDEKPANPS